MNEKEPEGSPQPWSRPALEEAHSPVPGRSRMVRLLIGFYALSLAAALFVALRAPAPSTPSKAGLKAGDLLSATRKDAVGWLPINGVISYGEGGSRFGHGVPATVRRLRAMAERKDVKAIVLDVNSPGGSVGAVQELYSQIQRVRTVDKKPVVAILNDVAASGGYYLAAGCDAVVSHPGTLVGSIGVIFNTANVEGLFGKIGIRSEPIKSGKMKDIGSMTRPMTKEERELLQGLIDDAYGQFLGAVAQGRKMSEESVRPLADGRIFTGRQALGLKLVDELGDSTRAVELAAKLGGISGKPEIVRDASDSLSGLLQMLDSSSVLKPYAAALPVLGEPGLEYLWRP
ncbi:MAG: signal peptide peptidase SppA [Elusimicrobiota bacterium]|jgi:protease-4